MTELEIFLGAEAGRGDSNHRTLSEATEARLATDILHGRLAPGTRLRFTALLDSYGVGTSPLREALARLVGRGLVVQHGQRGFWVAPVSVAELNDLTDTRVRLETMALSMAMERGNAAWEANLLAAYHRFSRHERSTDQLVDEAWEVLHRNFHFSLLNACGSPMLISFCQVLYDRFDRYRRLAVLSAQQHPNITGVHATLVDAAMSKNERGASELLAQHIREAVKEVARLAGPRLFSERITKQAEPIGADDAGSRFEQA